VSRLILTFAALSLFFLVLLVFLRTPFPPYPLVSWQDVLDLLTPVVLIPVCWAMYRRTTARGASEPADLAFVTFAAVWILGHGMHLSANSIHNLVDAATRRHTLDIAGSDLYRLIYFYDEHLSHPVWYAGILALAGLLVVREARTPAGIATVPWVTWVAGVVYGFTLFCIFVEGQTVYLGLPFAAIAAAYTLRTRRELGQRPLGAFFGVAFLAALLLFLAWGLKWRGFPQITDVGLI
jgi:hypothetical protein